MSVLRTASASLLLLAYLTASPLVAGSAGVNETAATVAELKRLVSAEIVGREASAEDRVFTRDTVAAYVGPSSEILLGFSFRLLLVREFGGGAGTGGLVVEVYDMSTSGDAFGYFSHGQPGERLDVGQEAVYRSGVLRFWKGNIFVALKGLDGTGEARGALLALGRRIAAAITRVGARPRIMSCLPAERIDRASVRYFHRQVSLDPHYYLADRNALFLDDTTDVALAKYPAGDKETLLLIIRYASTQDADKAFRRFGGDYFPVKIGASTRKIVEDVEPGEAAALSRTGGIIVLVLEAGDKSAAEALLESAESLVAREFEPAKAPGKM